MDRLADYKPPGYTGYVPGKAETFGRTPKLAQAEIEVPARASVLAARSAPPAPAAADTLTEAAAAHLGRAEAPNLWPSLQSTAAQPPAKPAVSMLAHKIGDDRIPAFASSYSAQFAAPFDASRTIRSPLRNTALASVADLRAVYRSAVGRVGEKRLDDIHHHMRERLQGKMGNRSDNAFRLRKQLFKMYDSDGSGLVDIESFRVMSEAFGIQFDDDSLLALFSKYDPEGVGKMPFHNLMRNLLDDDTYRLWMSSYEKSDKREEHYEKSAGATGATGASTGGGLTGTGEGLGQTVQRKAGEAGQAVKETLGVGSGAGTTGAGTTGATGGLGATGGATTHSESHRASGGECLWRRARPAAVQASSRVPRVGGSAVWAAGSRVESGAVVAPASATPAAGAPRTRSARARLEVWDAAAHDAQAAAAPLLAGGSARRQSTLAAAVTGDDAAGQQPAGAVAAQAQPAGQPTEAATQTEPIAAAEDPGDEGGRPAAAQSQDEPSTRFPPREPAAQCQSAEAGAAQDASAPSASAREQLSQRSPAEVLAEARRLLVAGQFGGTELGLAVRTLNRQQCAPESKDEARVAFHLLLAAVLEAAAQGRAAIDGRGAAYLCWGAAKLQLPAASPLAQRLLPLLAAHVEGMRYNDVASSIYALGVLGLQPGDALLAALLRRADACRTAARIANNIALLVGATRLRLPQACIAPAVAQLEQAEALPPRGVGNLAKLLPLVGATSDSRLTQLVLAEAVRSAGSLDLVCLINVLWAAAKLERRLEPEEARALLGRLQQTARHNRGTLMPGMLWSLSALGFQAGDGHLSKELLQECIASQIHAIQHARQGKEPNRLIKFMVGAWSRRLLLPLPCSTGGLPMPMPAYARSLPHPAPRLFRFGYFKASDAIRSSAFERGILLDQSQQFSEYEQEQEQEQA
eukprot:scaffold25.g5112.t1